MVPDQSFGADDVTTLEDYLAAVRNRKWVVLATALILLALTFLVTSGGVDSFTAEAKVQVNSTRAGISNPNLTAPAPNLDLEREILTGDNVSSAVAARPGIAPESVGFLKLDLKVSSIPASQFLTVEYTDTDPGKAALVATAFVEEYRDQREKQATDFFESQIRALNTRIAGFDAEASALDAQLTAKAAERLAEARGANRPSVLNGIDAEVVEIRSERATINTVRRTDQTALSAAELNLTLLAQQPTAVILQAATVPTVPNGVPRSYMLVGALIAGLFMGTAVAFLTERLDATARDEDDVALALGARVLGSIPTFPLSNRSGSSAAIMAVPDRKPKLALCREAFRRLRSSIQFAAATADAQVYLITSAYPGEGKSVVSANVAIALAQSGKQVALISADMRRPTMEKVLDVPNSDGLSDFLQGQVEMELKTVRGVDNLWVVPSGPPPANPGELLGSPQFETLIKELRQMAAYILIDTPPVLSTADAATAANYVDGVIVVVDSRKTETSDLLRVKDDLDRAGATLTGAVMNRTRGKRGLFSRRDAYAYYETGQS